MKKFLLIVLLVIIIALCAVLFLFNRQNSDSNPDGEGPYNQIINEPVGGDFGKSEIVPTNVNTSSRQEVVETTSGDTVVVTDVRNLPQTITFDEKAYKFADNGNVDAGYEIEYYAPDTSYTIFLASEPLAQARLNAEAAFLEILDISEAEACQLKVRVGTSIYVNQRYAGKNLGLSFCPGAVEL